MVWDITDENFETTDMVLIIDPCVGKYHGVR